MIDKKKEERIKRSRKNTQGPHAKILTALLQAKKITNREAAEIAGVSPTSIQDWKTGVSPTDYMAVAKLADHLGVSFRFILTGKKESEEGRPLPIEEAFESGEDIITGICAVRITRLIPRG